MNPLSNTAPPESGARPQDVSITDLESIARRLRFKLIEMSHAAGTPHLASALSCVDLLVAAYWKIVRINASKPADPLRDRFILSKGHAASALYATLAERGFFPRDWLDSFAKHGSPLAEQPSPGCAPGVELATGSLGHGLPVGLGMALAARIQRRDYRVFALMSDGECNEGTVWEAALMAPAQKVDNLAVIIDYNKWQATGRSEEVMNLRSLRDKWAAFGWAATEINGNNMSEVVKAFESISFSGGKPTAIIAHTVKGKGVSFMEDDNNWHYRVPTAEEVLAAKKELRIE
jgi:transketolase